MTLDFDRTEIDGIFENCFLDYASYVILDRAIPNIEDGLKPVQRRILWALNELDDGRFNKAANVIGHTMRYHPHGDAAIADAMVKLAQRQILMDLQGNWGNTATGDRAAAARYIETRLSKFANEVIFQSKVDKWQDSYDGRNKEPVYLPIKFPLLLAQGAEGIAVGLSTKILPHNFKELTQACIDYLSGKPFLIFPDFGTGGLIDVSQYKDGRAGGKVLMRAGIRVQDEKTLVIDSLPFGVTTTSLIDSIISANEKGKIKIRKVEDNTADKIEIVVYLPAQSAAEKMINALYAFTDCELSVSPQCCVIKEQKPVFCGVSDLLKASAEHTMSHLKRELDDKLQKLVEKLHFASLEQIFIGEKIYRKIEKAESFPEILKVIERGLLKHKENFVRDLTSQDVEKLTEIKIKRISKYDQSQADEQIAALKNAIEKINQHLSNLRRYTINYFKYILKAYGKGLERKTKITTFAKTSVVNAAIANVKVFLNKREGFIGTGLKNHEEIGVCTPFDDIFVVHRDMGISLFKIDEKVYVGKDISRVFVINPKKKYQLESIFYNRSEDEIYAKRIDLKLNRNKKVLLPQHTSKMKPLFVNLVAEEEKPSAVDLIDTKGKSKTVFFAELPIGDRKSSDIFIGKGLVERVSRSAKEFKLNQENLVYHSASGILKTAGKGMPLGALSQEDELFGITTSGYWAIEPVQLSYPLPFEPKYLCKNTDSPIDLILLIHNSHKGQYFAFRFKMDLAQQTRRSGQVLRIGKTEQVLLVTPFDANRGDDILEPGVKTSAADWPVIRDILAGKRN